LSLQFNSIESKAKQSTLQSCQVEAAVKAEAMAKAVATKATRLVEIEAHPASQVTKEHVLT
jgi:hypothetical protein